MKRQELAPAKVNLTLDVGARRPDGYHEVVSVMQSVALYDTVTMESGTGEGISLTCDDAAIPADGSNLAWRAAGGVLSHHRRGLRWPAYYLGKEYPLSGGVGRRQQRRCRCAAWPAEAVRPGAAHGGAGTHGHGVGQ